MVLTCGADMTSESQGQEVPGRRDSVYASYGSHSRFPPGWAAGRGDQESVGAEKCLQLSPLTVTFSPERVLQPPCASVSPSVVRVGRGRREGWKGPSSARAPSRAWPTAGAGEWSFPAPATPGLPGGSRGSSVAEAAGRDRGPLAPPAPLHTPENLLAGVFA